MSATAAILRPAIGLLWMITLLWAGSERALAHAIPTNTVMNAFVKIDPTQAQLVARIPMGLLPGLPFPCRAGAYDLAASGPVIELALQALADGLVLLEDGAALTPARSAGRLSALSDRSFESYESAAGHVDRPADEGSRVACDQSALDVHFTYPLSSPRAVFAIDSQVAADLGSAVKLVVRYIPPGESPRGMIVAGGSGAVALNPTWVQAAGSFVLLGIEHILSGIDHLLFLFCLVIPLRRLRGLLWVITAFTLAHSVTLFASALRLTPQGAWFPPFVETAIAASILYTALENVAGWNLRRRWLVSGLFGLVHGFGFADVLREQLQFAGSYLLASLLSFNVGIELGQMLVLSVIVPALIFARRYVAERKLVVALSAVAACVAARWMWERLQVLQQQEWPGAADLLSLARWPALLLLIVAVAAVLAKAFRRGIAAHPNSQGRAAP